MSKRVLELPVGHMYFVLPNGAAAQLKAMDVNVLQVALDHFVEHIEDLDPEPLDFHSDKLESAHFLKELVG